MLSSKQLFKRIAASNEGITIKDVRNLFIWYDLLSCMLPFQIIFILIYLNGSKNYIYTACAVLFVFFMDAVLKNSLERDGKNFTKLNKHVPFVKLWVIPLCVTGIATAIMLIATTLGLI